MKHYTIQAIVHGRMSQVQFEQAVSCLPGLVGHNGLIAARDQSRSVLRELTIFELELLVKDDMDSSGPGFSSVSAHPHRG